MGREIRKVPPNWEHPKARDGNYKPLHSERFEDVAREWKEGYVAWERGERPDYCTNPESRALEFWEWHGDPPDRQYYRDYRDEDATWFQIYENVSEGTPVTPPFATKAELVEHLTKHGTFWDSNPWPLKSAQAFVEEGYAPSMILKFGADGGGSIITPRDPKMYDRSGSS